MMLMGVFVYFLIAKKRKNNFSSVFTLKTSFFSQTIVEQITSQQVCQEQEVWFSFYANNYILVSDE